MTDQTPVTSRVTVRWSRCALVQLQLCTPKGKTLSRQKSGAGADDVYGPKRAWFKRADIFLKNFVSSRTTSNLVNTFVLLHNFLHFYYIHFAGYHVTERGWLVEQCVSTDSQLRNRHVATGEASKHCDNQSCG